MKKKYSPKGKSCQVTFELPAEVEAEIVSLCGDFNEWDEGHNTMKRRKDGSFEIKVSLKPGNEYRYRYLLDGKKWENDWNADKYVVNAHGTEDSVVVV